MKDNCKSQSITKDNNQLKNSGYNKTQKNEHSKFIDKAKLKIENEKIFKLDESSRKKYYINNKHNSKIIINSRQNYDIRKQFEVFKNKIQMIIINFLFLFQIIINNDRFLFNFYSNEITLKIRGNGNKKILSDSFSREQYPQKVEINGRIRTDITYQYYFTEDENIVVLTWEHKATSCASMFKGCYDINEMDLSKFDTSDVDDMNYMFDYCSSLTSINLSNLNTQNVKRLYCMFQGCSSLTSIDVSSFNTNKVTTLHYMFNGCESLTSINLENFHTPLVDEVEYMFKDCKNLEYINLKNFDGTHLNTYSNDFYKDMFANIPKNVVIEANDNILGNLIKDQLTQLNCLKRITNTNNWKSQQKKIIDSNGNCVNKCSENSDYIYEYNGKCFNNCNKGFIIDENTQEKICKCESEKCLHCPPVAIRFNLCTKCNEDYYQKENDNTNIGIYINCYEDPQGYYLDSSDHLYKKCYISCLTCEIKGNYFTHNCLRCKQTHSIEISSNNNLNCYEECTYYHYFDENKLYKCTIDLNCPEDYPYLITGKYEYSKNIDIIGIINRLGKNDTVLNYIEQYLTSEYYDTSSIDQGQDEIFNIEEEIIYSITTIDNQKKFQNKTRIDLGLCETFLKESYNLFNKTIYIKKLEIKENGMKIPKIEFDLYARLNGSKLEKLDLMKCKNRISLLIPKELNGNLDEFNSTSRYYNDICYDTTSDDGTDIILKDRQKEFVDKNKTICQEDCYFEKYNNEEKIAFCSCQIKESSISFADMKINKNQLFKAFVDSNNIANLNILKCYKKLLNKEGIINNIGFYLILSIIFLHIIDIFIFVANNFRLIKEKIKNIVSRINKHQLVKENEKKVKKNKKDNEDKIFIYTKNKKIMTKKLYIKNKKSLNVNSMNKIKVKNIKVNNKDKIGNINYYIDEEINGLSYDLAIKFDKRNYFKYYISLIKTQHNLICALFNNDDYNSKIIKIDLFFIGFTIEYTINTLFYNDETMHKIYESKGQFEFANQIPIVIYSNIISYVLNFPLNFLALSNDAIINFKQENSKLNIMKKAKQLMKILTIKFVLYFIISFLFLIFFWYYISMFGAIYKNTQIHLLKDILLSFGLSLFFPFVIYLFPGFFRIPALLHRKSKRECVYNFSKFLQIF